MQATTHSDPIEQTTDLARASSTTMRAIVQRAYGSSETLELTEATRPAVEADQVLVEVHAAGVDRGVWHLMTGMPYLVRLMGYGFTRPVDDMGPHNRPSHPELLDRLSDQLAAHDFDLDGLVRWIVLSEAFGLSNRRTPESWMDAPETARSLKLPSAAGN